MHNVISFVQQESDARPFLSLDVNKGTLRLTLRVGESGERWLELPDEVIAGLSVAALRHMMPDHVSFLVINRHMHLAGLNKKSMLELVETFFEESGGKIADGDTARSVVEKFVEFQVTAFTGGPDAVPVT